MWVGGDPAKAKSPGPCGRCGMRHIVVALTMLMVALVVTFAAASALQGVAAANDRASIERVSP